MGDKHKIGFWGIFRLVLYFSPLFFSSYILFKDPFEFYLPYIPMLVYTPFLVIRYGFPKALTILFICLFIVGLFDILEGQNEFSSLFKIWINLVFSAVYFYTLLKHFNLDIPFIFQVYLYGAVAVSILGIFQIVSWIIGFSPGYDYSMLLNKWSLSYGGLFGIRLNSIFSEPSYFGATVAPAFFISVYNLILRKRAFLSRSFCIIIVVAYLLSASTVAYLGGFLTIMLLLLNYGLIRYSLLALPVVAVLGYFTYQNDLDFRMRIDGLIALFSGEATSAFVVHGSSFVLYNNFQVMTNNLSTNPLTGSGLGSHQYAFDEFSVVDEFGGIYDFNRQDANSMLIRIGSETGLLGLFLTFLFIFKFFVRKKEDNSNELAWLISNAVITIIILQLLRQGNYTFNGFLFYAWLYYFTYLCQNKMSSSQQSLKGELTATG